MKSRNVILLILALVLGFLAYTNPTEAQYRAHIQEREGLMGTLGLGLADLLAPNGNKGVHRDNFVLWSKFYLGGDGILPRQDLAWGVAGKYFDLDQPKR